MKYVRITATEDGESIMEEIEADVSPVDFIPGQPSLDLSPAVESQSTTFIRTPANWVSGWHPSPRRQFVIGIAGELEIQATSGRTCSVGAGNVVLLEDTVGKGHHTKVVGGNDWWGVLIGLP